MTSLVVPDIVANAGRGITVAIERRKGSETEANAAVDRRIAENTAGVLDSAAVAGTPRAAAVALAHERVRSAMGHGGIARDRSSSVRRCFVRGRAGRDVEVGLPPFARIAFGV